MYEDASRDDLIRIFADTVVLYKKKPVYIGKVVPEDKINSLTLLNLENLNEKLGDIPVNSPDFDFTPVPLGFCNHNKGAFFLQRIPKRQYKQGLCSDNLRVQPIMAQYNDLDVSQLSTVRSRSLAHCIKGNYPSLATAIKLIIEEKYNAVAFARNFAIDSDLNLFFKEKKVGMVDKSSAKLLFQQSLTYLERLVNA